MKTKKIAFLFYSTLLIFIILTSCIKEKNNEKMSVFRVTNDTLVLQELTSRQSSPGKVEFIREFQYNKLGILIKSIQLYFNTDSNKYLKRSYDTLIYNSNKQLISKLSYFYERNSIVPKLTSTETHTFPNDSTEKIENLNVLTSYINSTIITRINNLIVKKELYNNIYLNQTITYDYYPDNHVRTEKYYNNSGILYETKEYTYDTDKTLITTYTKDLQIGNINELLYENTKLKTIHVKDFTWNMEQDINKFEYDDFGRLCREFKNPVQYPYMSMIVQPSIIVYQYALK